MKSSTAGRLKALARQSTRSKQSGQPIGSFVPIRTWLARSLLTSYASLVVGTGTLAAQAPTIEQRVSLLEQQVQQLRALQHLDSNRVVADTSVPATLRGNDDVRWGYPGGRGTVLIKEHFVILHDGARRVPIWVTYHLTREELQAGTEPRTDNFRPDGELPVGQRSELADYRNSGYDRGHMAPAADFKRDQAAMSETFLLSNMAPQRPHLNREIWAHLEDEVRALALAHGSIWIFTGALYLDSLEHPIRPTDFIGPDSVAVPTHFYKVILCEHADGRHEMFAFVMPNSLAPLPGHPSDYVRTVTEVQRMAGLDFFAMLPDDEEHRLESIKNSWPVH